jgi:hypothetical protein
MLHSLFLQYKALIMATLCRRHPLILMAPTVSGITRLVEKRTTLPCLAHICVTPSRNITGV